MVPPSTTPDFILAGIALIGSSFWLLWTRENSLKTTIQTLVTVFALAGVVALLFLTFLRFGCIDAVLNPGSGFSEPVPLWRALPAVGTEIASILCFLSSSFGARSVENKEYGDKLHSLLGTRRAILLDIPQPIVSD